MQHAGNSSELYYFISCVCELCMQLLPLSLHVIVEYILNFFL